MINFFLNSFKNLNNQNISQDIINTDSYSNCIEDKNRDDLAKKFETEKKKQFIFSYISSEKTNEKISYIDDLSDKRVEGDAIITDYCFHFIGNTGESIKIPLFIISKIKEIDEKNNNNSYTLEFWTKNNRNFKFLIKSENMNFYNMLNYRAFPKKSNKEFYLYAERFAFNYILSEDFFEDKEKNGWLFYDPFQEFKRQELDENKFVISDINRNFNICSTYPEVLVVPKSIKSEKIQEASNFRTKNRFPVVCWYNKESKTSLLRSSQTKTGFNIGNFNRSEADENYLLEVRGQTEDLDIFDARPYLNAFANKFKGAGFENTSNYKNTRITFCEIENIHYVRGCFEKMNKIFGNSRIWENKTYFSDLETTGWLEMISIILSKTILIVKALLKNSVLIHCSDGWDRTAQLTSLTQLLIDPFYRTFKGFCILIEKEWISYGHMFAYRNGFHVEDLSENNYSPIFIQFLECVYNIVIQFPDKFEFNISLLEFIAYHVYTGRYGTFLFNNEKDRMQNNSKKKTISIWSDVINKRNYKNPDYVKTDLNKNDVIFPITHIFKLKIWEEYFLRENQIKNTNLGRISFGDTMLQSTCYTSYNYYLEERLIQEKELDVQNEKNKKLIEAIKEIAKNGNINLFQFPEYEEIKDLLK